MSDESSSPCCSSGPNPSDKLPADSTMEQVQEVVKYRYGKAAKAAAEGSRSSCCTAPDGTDPISSGLYDDPELASLPEEVVRASLGCGNPTALAIPKPGQTVLDLGSGGGIDAFLAARKVGPTGFVYGLDMTDEMLEIANRQKGELGIPNVKFIKGTIENIPLPDQSVDLIISNCVINLSSDKERVLSEAHRVLREGGMFAISDVTSKGTVPEEIKRNLELHLGCIAGALEMDEYSRLLRKVGFNKVEVEPVRVYEGDAWRSLAGEVLTEKTLEETEGLFVSAFVRGWK